MRHNKPKIFCLVASVLLSLFLFWVIFFVSGWYRQQSKIERGAGLLLFELAELDISGPIKLAARFSRRPTEPAGTMEKICTKEILHAGFVEGEEPLDATEKSAASLPAIALSATGSREIHPRMPSLQPKPTLMRRNHNTIRRIEYSQPPEKRFSASTGNENAENDLLKYQQLVREILEERKIYPRKARKAGIEGLVRLSFLVSKDGKLQDVRLIGSSEHEILDQAALHTVSSINLFPPLPEGLRADTLRLYVAISYKLD